MKYALLLFVFAVISFSQSAFAMGERVPTETGDYCKDQALSYIRHKWGANVQIRNISTLGNGTTWEQIVQTDLCDGNFIFRNMGVEHFQCTTAQYGGLSQFLTRVYAFGDCQRLLPDGENL